MNHFLYIPENFPRLSKKPLMLQNGCWSIHKKNSYTLLYFRMNTDLICLESFSNQPFYSFLERTDIL